LSGEKPYRIVSAPTAERSEEMLFVERESNRIYHGNVSHSEGHASVALGSCSSVCVILDVAWLPDGSGFVYSRYESNSVIGPGPPESGALYRYDFATGQSREIMRFPDEAIGKLSIAPDGEAIVFERGPYFHGDPDTFRWGPRVLCPCQLWTLDMNSSNLQMLVEDGRAPAWSPTVPTVSVVGR
ncbi:MAG: hypothetical protein OEU26_33570, partial [Candidatus Tectomicrobia bacterium]|nr:hypothetical protein [Candidatus Tectomicrobia bacterium]